MTARETLTKAAEICEQYAREQRLDEFAEIGAMRAAERIRAFRDSLPEEEAEISTVGETPFPGTAPGGCAIPCCGEYATCLRACTPRGEWIARQRSAPSTEQESAGDTPRTQALLDDTVFTMNIPTVGNVVVSKKWLDNFIDHAAELERELADLRKRNVHLAGRVPVEEHNAIVAAIKADLTKAISNHAADLSASTLGRQNVEPQRNPEHATSASPSGCKEMNRLREDGRSWRK